MKRVLVTGATGFLGFRTLEYLLEDGSFELIGAARTYRSHREIQHPLVSYVYGDLTEPEYVQSLFDHSIDIVVNCASLSAPWGREGQFMVANVDTQKLLLEASSKHGISRFVYISSPSIYVNLSDRFNLTEKSPLYEPVNAYAKTKRHAEALLKKSSVPHVILRPRALIGRGDSIIFPRLIKAHIQGRLRKMGNGDNICDLTCVKNVAHAIKCAILADESALNEDYNITNGEPVKLWPVIEEVLGRLNYPAITGTFTRSKAMRIAGFLETLALLDPKRREPLLLKYSVSTLTNSMTFNIAKAKERLGYLPLMTTQEGIDEFIASLSHGMES
jgi:nucleoside-diphosphate-sugar epimerase